MKNMNTLPRFFGRLLKELPLLVLVALLAGSALSLFQAPVARADTLTVCASGCDHTSIQAAIDAATAGDTINVAAGTYAPTATINVNKAVTLIGAGQGVTIIDAVGMPALSYGILVTAGNVSLQNFTLQNAKSYGIKVQGNISNVTIQNVTVQNSARSNIDFNGVDNITVTGVVVTGAVYGVGLAITDGNGASISNITTSGNAWAGIAIYTSTNYPPAGSSNITLSGTNSFGEPVAFYTEPTNPNDPITNINITSDFHWTVRRTATPTTIAYFQTLTAAKTAVEASPATISTSALYDLDNARFFVPYKAAAPAYTIQAAVDVASAGDTVLVEAGTYVEQVTITKDLSLLGAGQATTTIQAFASMPTCFTTSTANHPVVCVMNAVATIDGFTIDGLGLGNSNVRFQGVAFRNAGGTLQNSTIKDIRDTPFSGSQHGVAVYAFNENTTHYTIHVLDNTITGFQKNAMALNAGDTTPLTVDVQRNVVTGVGTTTVTAQNGIQVWADLGSGVVADNTIGGIAYDGTGWVASSILNYYTDLDITGNTITGAHTGIYNIDGAGRIADNELAIIKAAGYAYGIIATDPPGAVPAPYEPQAKPEGKNLNSIGALAVLDVEVANNVLTFSGADKTGSSAIEADGGYGANDLSVNVHHNSVTGFDYGLTFYQCESSCLAGAFTGISVVSNDLLDNTKGIYLGGPIAATVIPTIHHNRIYGNVVTDKGLVNDLTVAVTAENNWWGCNEGPANAACVGTTGLVDADPWLVLSAVAVPATVPPSGVSVVTANLIFNSAAINTSGAGYVPNGIPLAFTTPDGGTVNPSTGATLNGADNTTFTAPVVDQAYQVCTDVDNELYCVSLMVTNYYIHLPIIRK